MASLYIPSLRPKAIIKKAAALYLKSWMLLLWSAACVCIGAAWMFVSIAIMLKAKGLIH